MAAHPVVFHDIPCLDIVIEFYYQFSQMSHDVSEINIFIFNEYNQDWERSNIPFLDFPLSQLQLSIEATYLVS
jgi:hypothetical protein